MNQKTKHRKPDGDSVFSRQEQLFRNKLIMAVKRFSVLKQFVFLTLLLWAVASSLNGCCGKSYNQEKGMRIVCFGDSLTTCGGKDGRYSDWLVKMLPDCEIINRGVGGDTLESGRKRFVRDVMQEAPDILVFELGANDYWSRKRPLVDLKKDYEYMIKSAHDAGIKIVIAGCFGANHAPDRHIDTAKAGLPLENYASGIAAMEFEFAERYRCIYIPAMQKDIKPNGIAPFWTGGHPNKGGNRLVAQRIKAAIDQLTTKQGDGHHESYVKKQQVLDSKGIHVNRAPHCDRHHRDLGINVATRTQQGARERKINRLCE